MLNSALSSSHFYGTDGNGNISALVKASDGTVSANYEYDPFGRALRATGPMANENRFCFSTKRCDSTSGFVLYEHRALRTDIGRWLNRDSIQEKGGINLLCFARNDPIGKFDILGLLPPVDMPGQPGWPPPLECTDPCGAAKRQHMDKGDAAGIICCEGKSYICIWSPGGVTDAKTPKAQEIITECTTKHEQVHIENTRCSRCNPFYRPRDPLIFYWQVKAEECKAYKIEKACLESKLSLCDGDATCKAEVKTEISGVNVQISEKCGSKK